MTSQLNHYIFTRYRYRKLVLSDIATNQSIKGTRHGKETVLLTAVSVQFLIADLALAQESAAVLEEIVVTAQKREESIADVGIAVDVVSGDRLREAGALSLIEVGRFSPGLNIQTPFGEFGYPLIAIRGVNTDGFIETLPQSTGVYADGVYVSQPPMQAFRLLDLERMEVLKGPQGTIYGRNTIAGAINLISKRPTFEPEGYATVGFGRYSRGSFEGAYGGPISDTAAGRVAVKYLRQTDSPLTNTYPGQDDGGELDQLMARGSLLFRPNDDVELLVRVYRRPRRFRRLALGVIPAGQDIDGDGIPDQVCPEYARGDYEAAAVRCLARDPFVSGNTFNDTDGDPYTINQNAIGNHNYRSSGISVELNWNLARMTLTTVTGWTTSSATTSSMKTRAPPWRWTTCASRTCRNSRRKCGWRRTQATACNGWQGSTSRPTNWKAIRRSIREAARTTRR